MIQQPTWKIAQMREKGIPIPGELAAPQKKKTLFPQEQEPDTTRAPVQHPEVNDNLPEWRKRQFQEKGIFTNGAGLKPLDSNGYNMEGLPPQQGKNELKKKGYAIEKWHSNIIRVYPANTCPKPTWGIDALLNASPQEAEIFAAHMLSAHGWDAARTTKSKESGVDAIGFKGKKVLAIQVKLLKEKVGSVRDVDVNYTMGGALMYKATHVMFITTGRYTKSAYEIAASHEVIPCNLIEGNLLFDSRYWE